MGDQLLGSARRSEVRGPRSQGWNISTASESRSKGRSQRFYPTWRGFHPLGGTAVQLFNEKPLICSPSDRHQPATDTPSAPHQPLINSPTNAQRPSTEGPSTGHRRGIDGASTLRRPAPPPTWRCPAEVHSRRAPSMTTDQLPRVSCLRRRTPRRPHHRRTNRHRRTNPRRRTNRPRHRTRTNSRRRHRHHHRRPRLSVGRRRGGPHGRGSAPADASRTPPSRTETRRPPVRSARRPLPQHPSSTPSFCFPRSEAPRPAFLCDLGMPSAPHTQSRLEQLQSFGAGCPA